MILFIIQNSYRSEKHPFATHAEWMRELFRSHTGRRLTKLVPDGCQFDVINASSNIGDGPDSVFPADPDHIRRNVEKIKPALICACGKIAQNGCDQLGLDYVSSPHPAWRCFSTTLAVDLREEIKRRMRGMETI